MLLFGDSVFPFPDFTNASAGSEVVEVTVFVDSVSDAEEVNV